MFNRVRLFLCISAYFVFSALLPALNAQVIRTGNIQTFIDSLVNSIPSDTGTNIYTVPSTGDTAQWRSIVTNVINGNYSSAHSDAGSMGYGLTQFTDEVSGKAYYILAKTSASSNYWGIYAFNNSAIRQKLLIQAPHPVFDFKTGLQSAYVFIQTGARALFVSGVHRCNSTSRSECAGTTTVCSTVGASDKFRKSDPAHNEDGLFHKTLLVLEALISNTISVQLHGFSWVSGDPDLLMSNGTTSTPSPDYLSTLKDKLLDEDDTLEFGIHHISPLSKLTGTTNVQGRFINNSSNPCSSSASTASGRFLHIEQAYKNLRDNQTNWNKIVNALSNTFPEDPLPVEMTGLLIKVVNNKIMLNWRTETETNNYGFEIERGENYLGIDSAVSFRKIGFIQGGGNRNSSKDYFFADETVLPGRTYWYRIKQIDNDGSFNYSRTISANTEISGPELLTPYPNPFSESLTIGFISDREYDAGLSLYNSLGEEIYCKTISGCKKGYSEILISMEKVGAAPGVYYLRFFAGNYVQTRKLIHLK